MRWLDGYTFFISNSVRQQLGASEMFQVIAQPITPNARTFRLCATLCANRTDGKSIEISAHTFDASARRGYFPPKRQKQTAASEICFCLRIWYAAAVCIDVFARFVMRTCHILTHSQFCTYLYVTVCLSSCRLVCHEIEWARRFVMFRMCVRLSVSDFAILSLSGENSVA